MSAHDELAMRRNKLLVAAACDPKLRGVPLSVLSLLLFDYLHRKPGRNYALMWPSVRKIAERIGASERQVRRSLSILVEKAIIRVVRAGGGGVGSSTRYGMGGGGNRPPTSMSAKEDTGVRKTLTRVSPNLVEHPSKEPTHDETLAIIQQTAKTMKAPTPSSSVYGRGIQPQDDTQIAFEELKGRMQVDEYRAFVQAHLLGDPHAITLAEEVAMTVRDRRRHSKMETD